MWKKRLNSVTLVNVTHRGPGKVTDGTSTQVRVHMINRCRVKMSKKGLYKLGDSLQKGGSWSNLKKITFVSFVSCLGNLYEQMPLRI